MASLPSSELLDKTAGVVIVEPTMSIAGTIRRVLLETGYSNVYIAHSVLDAFNTLSNNRINWMIVAPLAEEKLSQWHCLRLPLEIAAYQSIMVSVLINPEHVKLKNEFYAFGALSVHSRQLTFNSFQEELGDLLSRLTVHPTVEAAIASDVRRTLEKSGQIEKLEAFEQAFFDHADSSPEQKLRLIEARLKCHANLEAMQEIQDLAAAHPDHVAQLKELSQAYLGTSDIQTFRGPLPVANVLILDPDETQQQFLKGIFAELGSELIVCCTTLEEACEKLHVGAMFDVIITEWKLHEVKGHAFIQHVRHHGHERQPVFIHSSLVKAEDQALIDEIGGVFIIPKPTTKKIFKQILSETIERWNNPQKGDVHLDKILAALSAGRVKEARTLSEDFLANPKIDKRQKDFAQANIAFHEGRYEEAKGIILANAKLAAPGHKEISLLGKVLLRLGDPQAALKFLEQANQMVPGNIDRLCQLADANSGVGKTDKALTLAREAHKIGGDIEMVQTTLAKHAVAAGDFEEVQESLESEHTAREMVSFINNLGIAHANVQKWEESEKAYASALQALDGRHPQLRAIVSYNFGLSLVRQNKLSESLAHLKEAEQAAEPFVRRKILDLRERVEQAIASKQPMVLKEAIKELSAPKVAVAKTQVEEYRKHAKTSLHGLFGVLKNERPIPGIDLHSEMPKSVLRKDKAES